MIIRKLSLQNIRSYEELEIEFPKGSILLSGEIGSGKTSILLGIQFALFGLQPGQKGSSILRSGTNEAYARIEIEVGGEVINIERTIKKSKTGSITQEKNILTTRDERTEMSTSEIKTRVIELLSYPKEFAKKSNLLYKFTVYTPQEEMKNIIEERQEVRLDTIRHIFGIDRYKRIKDNAGILMQKIKESVKIKEILIGELSLLKEKLQIETEHKIKLVRETNNLNLDLKDLETETENVKNKREEIEKKLDERRRIDSEVKRIEALIQGKKALEQRLKKEIINMQKETSEEIDFSYERLKSVEEILKKHKDTLEEKNKEYMKINNQVSVLESQKERPLSLREKVTSMESCPTCHQIVSKEHKEKITKKTIYELEDIERELEQKIIFKSQIIKEIEREKQLIKEYERDGDELKKNRLKYEHQKTISTKIKSDAFVLDRTTNEIISHEKEIEELKSKIIRDYQEEFNTINKEYEQKRNELRKIEIEFATKNKELEMVKKGLEELAEEISNKEKIKDQLIYLRQLQEWLQEKFLSMITITEKNVLSKIRTEFSSIFSSWFSMLVSPELTVRLDEDFTPIISNQDYEMDYSFLSGGERTAVALSYRLALNQVLNTMLSKIKTKDLVILDEPTDGFASEQIDKMRDLFTQLNAKQLILVSHEEKIEGFVDHVIKIKKDSSSKTEEIMN